jgi:hypothetical protein
LPILLATETQIASYKPTQWDPADLRKQANQAIDRLRPATEDRWKKLTIQLEANPTMVQLSFLGNKDYCTERMFYWDKQMTEFVAEAARPQLMDLFMDALRTSGNQTHLEALALVVAIMDSGIDWHDESAAFTFVRGATCLGFLGRTYLFKLGEKYGEKYGRAYQTDSVEEEVAVLSEALGLSISEYHRKLLQDLHSAASATKGLAMKRLMVLYEGAENVMRKPFQEKFQGGMGAGYVGSILVDIAGIPFISKGDGPNVTDSEVEALLSFFVDSGLARNVEEPMIKYLEACAVGEEKPKRDVLTCPLKGAIQPPWCPGCSGKLEYALERRAIRYEADEGLNQNCPIIKEWLGEKKLHDQH